MKISINEPCQENWDAMTPNTQGAFCKSCLKDVVDFSKMGVTQIKLFFSKNESSEKICGRFKETQLQELSFDDFFSRFRYWNFTKKFAVIFFLFFGFWVFSNSLSAQNTQHLKGEVMIMPDKTPKKDTTKKKDPKNIKMGKIKCDNTPRNQACKKETKMMMGDVAAPIENKQPLPTKKED